MHTYVYTCVCMCICIYIIYIFVDVFIYLNTMYVRTYVCICMYIRHNFPSMSMIYNVVLWPEHRHSRKLSSVSDVALSRSPSFCSAWTRSEGEQPGCAPLGGAILVALATGLREGFRFGTSRNLKAWITRFEGDVIRNVRHGSWPSDILLKHSFTGRACTRLSSNIRYENVKSTCFEAGLWSHACPSNP